MFSINIISNTKDIKPVSSARMFLLARMQDYPEMKLKSWKWLYEDRYCIYCYRTKQVTETFDVFLSIKNVKMKFY